MGKIDFSGVEPRKFDALPNDWYKVIFDQIEVTESQAGEPMLKLVHRVLHNLEGEEEGCANRLLFGHKALDPDASWASGTREMLDQLEIKPKGFDPDNFADEWTGVELWIKVTARRRTGEAKEQYGEWENNIRQYSLEKPDATSTKKNGEDKSAKGRTRSKTRSRRARA